MADEPSTPGMIGPSPSERGLPAIPADPAEHARRSAREWRDVVEAHVRRRMRNLGIPRDRVGMPDYDHDGGVAAFHPDASLGRGVSPDGRIIIDGGVLYPALFDSLGEEVARAYRQASVRDRVDAAIAHEYEEYRAGMDHELAVENAPDTALPIGHGARELAHALRDAVRSRRHADDPSPPP